MHAHEPVPSYRELLRVPSIGRILVGMALSRIAASMLGVAIVLFALDRFGSPALAGIVTFTSVAPGMLLSPIAGALLDRHGRSRLIIADQLVGAASLVLIALLALAGSLTPALLIVITAITSLTAPLSNVGLRTLFPIIVPRRLWERVNAVDSNGYVLATLVGPPVAGVLVQVAGGPQALLAIAALYGISALVFLRLADPPSEVPPSGRLIDNAWQGLRYTLLHPTLRALGLSIAILNLGWGIVTIAIPVLLIQDMGLGESVVGLVFAVSGVTGGISALVAGRWRTQGRERAMLVWPMVGMTLAAGAIMVSPTLPMLVAAMAVQGFLNGPLDVALFTLRQRRTDPAWLGRAFAVSMSLNFSGYPIGAALGGALLAIGPTATLAAAAIATAGGAIVAWWMLPRDGQPEPVSPGPGGAGEPSAATRPGDAADSADAPA